MAPRFALSTASVYPENTTHAFDYAAYTADYRARFAAAYASFLEG